MVGVEHRRQPGDEAGCNSAAVLMTNIKSKEKNTNFQTGNTGLTDYVRCKAVILVPLV
jgi:hypothetical protein